MLNKKGQVTIFLIIAIIIFASILAFFTIKNLFIAEKIPASIEPIYNNFLTCLEQDTDTGINLLASQAGYIELPEFESGSEYMPFSSQFNFLGNPIPYWYYVSGNNFEREQVPSKEEMESQLGDFIKSRYRNCDFSTYNNLGFDISIAKPTDIQVSINGGDVEVILYSDLGIEKGEDSALISSHRVVIQSKLGTLYDSAVKVYDEEQEELFLEEYAVDTLRLYAPVDGTELTCSPLIWNAEEVFDDLQDAIEINTLALGTDSFDKYYRLSLPVSQKVRFLNSRNWPFAFEVLPSEENLLIANPVGNQEGIGLLGFCYVPYHFVYDVKYPVLIQISEGDEIFQFPVTVIIENNNPRESLEGNAIQIDSEFCLNKNIPFSIRVRNTNLQSVDALLSYECIGTSCNIGSTKEGVLSAEFPQCINGYLIARAEGYNDAKYLLSTMNAGSIEIILDKLYEKPISLKLDGITYEENALISFSSQDNVKTIVYPEQKNIELSKGQYEISVQVFKDSALFMGDVITEQCIDVPRTGIMGVFGLQNKKCFDVEVPEQKVSSVLIGGGTANIYLTEDDLNFNNKIEIDVPKFSEPTSLEQLQKNYVLFDESEIYASFV